MTKTLEQLVEDGDYVLLELIRFDLPGHPVGYHAGGRPFTWNGMTYKPNRWLQAGDASSSIGASLTSRTVVFSNVPVADADDAVAQLETMQYLNAPVILSYLAGDPETDEPVGVLYSHLYEIDRVWFPDEAAGEDGSKALTINIELQPPGRSARGSTLARVSPAEHNHDNDANDTCLEHAAVVSNVVEEWGMVAS